MTVVNHFWKLRSRYMGNFFLTIVIQNYYIIFKNTYSKIFGMNIRLNKSEIHRLLKTFEEFGSVSDQEHC